MDFKGNKAVFVDFREIIKGKCFRCLARSPPVSKIPLKHGCDRWLVRKWKIKNLKKIK
jgi:hypothetical protein